jgi:hypothetical protein
VDSDRRRRERDSGPPDAATPLGLSFVLFAGGVGAVLIGYSSQTNEASERQDFMLGGLAVCGLAVLMLLAGLRRLRYRPGEPPPD